MQSAVALLCLILGGAAVAPVAAGAGRRAAVTPVQKVVTLLGDLEAKITKNGAAEDKAYADYMEFCKDGSKDKGFEIQTAKAEIEDLEATIKKADADASAASEKIESLASSIATDEADLKAATEIRTKEKAEFDATEVELVSVIDTLDRAINILERNLKGSALMQTHVNIKDLQSMVQALSAVVEAASLSSQDKQRLLALAQSDAGNDDSDDDLGAPEPEAYKKHSAGIIDVLEDLRDKAETQLNALRHQETNAKHSFDMTKQDLEDSIKYESKELTESKSTKAEAEGTKAHASGDLSMTQQSLSEAEETLANMETDCKQKVADHEASVASRKEELEALAAAKQAITNMTGAAEATVYGGASFLQVAGGNFAATQVRLSTHADLAGFEVVNVVRQLAKKEKSGALMQLAGRIQAALRYGVRTSQDPFAKVKAMISEMISKLEEEAGIEASHKAYCDKEYAETKQKTDELKHDIDGLTTKIDKKRASSVTLKAEAQDAQAELAALAKSQAEMDKLRSEEHKVFVQTKADLQQGLEGVRMALKVLREYYGNEAALVQQPVEPELHEKASGAGHSVIGMLEVVEADFGKSLASAEVEEDASATEYEKISMQNRLSTAQLEQDVKYKTKEAAGLDKAVVELSSDLETAQTELDAVLDYTKGIRAQCELKPETYEERAARRTAEIEGLKNALSILEGDAALLQKHHRSALRGALVSEHRQ